MKRDLFPPLESFLDRDDPIAGFDFLIDHLLNAHEYALVFEARLMKRRFQLGLPLVQTETISADRSEPLAEAAGALSDSPR